MINSFRRAGLGTKLSLLTGMSVAILFLLFTFLLSHKASQQLEDLAVEDLHNQSTGMVDMVQMFNTSLSEESKAIPDCSPLSCLSHLRSITVRPVPLAGSMCLC